MARDKHNTDVAVNNIHGLMYEKRDHVPEWIRRIKVDIPVGKMQSLVAVMRKILHAIFGIFKHHQPYDGTKLFALPNPQEVICP